MLGLSSCMTTGAQAVKFLCPEMMQFPERPPHPSLSPSFKKKIKETFPSSHVIIVLSRDSAWTLDFQIVQVWSHWKCCKSCFHRGRISQKGGITDTVSHADLLCSFKDFSQKQRSWKPQNLPQFGKKAKNLQWLWSRTLLLADRQTTVRS